MISQELPVGVTEEQRKFKRFDVYVIVEIKSIDRPRQSSLGIIRDFSYDGFSFEFHAPDFTLQDKIEFTLRHPKGNLSVTFYGDLIWKEQDYTECLIGIKLRTMDQDTKNRYIEIISASGNMPVDLESYERETAGVIGEMEEEQPVAVEEPVAEPRVRSALKTPQKETGKKPVLYFVVAAVVIAAIAVLSYIFVIEPETKPEYTKVAVTKKIEDNAVKIEKPTVKQVEKIKEATDKRYDYTSIYTIQTGSFTESALAFQHYGFLAEKFNKKELAFLRIEQIGNYYTVRLGKFDDFKSAKRFLSHMAPGISDGIILKANIENERIKKIGP